MTTNGWLIHLPVLYGIHTVLLYYEVNAASQRYEGKGNKDA